MKRSLSLVAVVAVTLSTVACGPSLESMHARAGAGEVDTRAPIHARRDVTIQAPPDAVWAVLTDFAAWPEWQSNVRDVTPPRTVAAGEAFRWTTGGNEISSTLALVEPEKRLAWTGTVATAKAIHVFRIRAVAPRTTLVEVEETMDGFLLTWFYGQRELEADVERSLAQLQRAAERRGGG